ncbi:RNA polymerase sigma54 factor [Campylobacter iguaniorum]|uniref:RNA polymerase sigma54 factor n=1 Tax=Campylobacter iguaniorum TaxID=1244531 RepID=A0A076F8W5_9BACT|nr:RNA polymerase factor sigma-54 [Campylobacter iguaniorum]AII14675.1 RNA polymerase sigma54 factor [Campylobacter iguaniorum]ALV24410.1 RNA polymerase sigma54 factor [Campylobacter iguaniorum]ANE35849.1 RNA polymerase sigma54 factor [Campylobacter iguaniorum]
MKLAQKVTQKAKLNQTLRSWLPILQASSDELKDTLEPFIKDNPFAKIEIDKPHHSKNFYNEFYSNHVSDRIEQMSVYECSLYEKLYSQIDKPLFPTQKSKDIANAIIECINSEGYFEYNDEILAKFDAKDVEKIRKRFAYLEPIGVGAKDYKESFLFQLDELCDDDEIYTLAKDMINDFENLSKYTKQKNYENALKIIKKFKNPPAVEYLEDEAQVTPDIYVFTTDEGVEVKVNDEFYPEILIDTEGIDEKCEFVSSRIKEARDLIDALEMRKATLYKIGLMIIEYQYDYFLGGDIKPMKLKDIAGDLGRNPSTISRAIQNKFLSCSRGIVALKNFFAAAASEDISNAAIKDFVKNLIKQENHQKPLSDEAILACIEKDFGIKIVRRTITKYRKALNIGSSSQRKKIYAINS